VGAVFSYELFAIFRNRKAAARKNADVFVVAAVDEKAQVFIWHAGRVRVETAVVQGLRVVSGRNPECIS